MSYSAKFHSKFYGPFRVAADSAPKAGAVSKLTNRATYQIDPGNLQDARACSLRDAEEGADILMVKPGLPYLDVLAKLSQEIQKPWAVYEVSGEFAAIELMAEQGLISAPEAHLESWTAFVRAGASMIITYGARFGRDWLENSIVNSGTEAVMAALRVARAATGRSKILKFDGCYHGHVDSMLVRAGSGLAEMASPDSAGVSTAVASETIVVPLNDLDAVKQAFSQHQIAAVIIEPVPANNGLLLQTNEFLKEVARIAPSEKALVIFDEVITGFRTAFGEWRKSLASDRISSHRPLLERLIRDWQSHQDGRAQVELDAQDLQIEADPVAMHVILKNLLENSVRHSKQSPVKIKISNEQDPSGVILHFKDNGQAFSGNPKRLGLLFEKGETSQGAGVGLYLIQALMKRMGGLARFSASNGGFEVALTFKEASHG
ncbi:unnamed protein product [Sphagnum jensenii]|uniref:Delta-aminolevulinic acid dehydratase n=1 Tax=Sphagnum jensenii TaxID=128206 RepID=A0ABP0V729_9BRYO